MPGGYGGTSVISSLLLLLFLHLAAGSGSAENQPPYLVDLLESARRLELSRERYWQTLLHYKETLFGVESLIDDPAFFLAPGGKKDPELELEATIRAFFQEPDGDGRHPVCRFVARFNWLKERLGINVSRLPLPECRPFREIVERIRPESASLIFPTSHMNSPASMFGHTLLTIDTAYGSRLLSYAVNYSAVTTDTFGPLFAFKGLFGFYKGYFSILPYYAKIQEYSDVDRRDIWEYPLNLDKEEIHRLLMHVYELEFIYSDYFFFDENCSYDLLFLLDAARPSLNLTDQCKWWVIPLDTIKIVKENDLVKETIFRPSHTTKITFMASLLSEGGREEALRMAKGDLDPVSILEREMPEEDKVGICDLAIEYLQYLYIGKELSKDAYTERFLKVLEVRSLLGSKDACRYEVRIPDEPESGHDAARLSVGVGVENEGLFQELRFRPAYHTLTDNKRGFKEGAQIVFADTALRYYPSDNRLSLEKLDLIDIVSLSPSDAFFHPVSWKVKTGLHRRLTREGERELLYNFNLGGGWAYRIDRLGLFYVFLETDVNVGGALREDYAGGVGGSAGFITDFADFWRVYLFAGDVYYALGDAHDALRIGLVQNFEIDRNMSLSLEISREEAYHEQQTEAALYWNIFF